ncbi:uncharacterized protein LOC135893275 [Emys orbicularis]|uniref:uncharacterized protein LOC135893275 n=1 Tax=Emys orbicularis TaxID=82168 RepID=UPI0031FBE9B7
MLALGVIQPSASPWASPVVLVPKKDGSIRFCVDYRKLNAITVSDAYPMPRTDEILDKLGGARYLTTLDLTKGYWQVPLDPEARAKSAFTTPIGLLEFLVLPFGLKRAPATFQRLVDQLLRGMEGFALAYIDDICVFSQTWEEHVAQVKRVLGRLQDAGLTIKAEKCKLIPGLGSSHVGLGDSVELNTGALVTALRGPHCPIMASALTVLLLGCEFLKPTIWVSPSRVVALGGSVTIRCEGQQRSMEFFLRKPGHPNRQVRMVPDGTVAEFPITSVGQEDGGSYTCDYRSIADQNRWSYPSDPVDMIVGAQGSEETLAPVERHPGARPQGLTHH